MLSYITYKYWVSQKVLSDFSVSPYGKAQTNFLANPIDHCGFSAQSGLFGETKRELEDGVHALK